MFLSFVHLRMRYADIMHTLMQFILTNCTLGSMLSLRGEMTRPTRVFRDEKKQQGQAVGFSCKDTSADL